MEHGHTAQLHSGGLWSGQILSTSLGVSDWKAHLIWGTRCVVDSGHYLDWNWLCGTCWWVCISVLAIIIEPLHSPCMYMYMYIHVIGAFSVCPFSQVPMCVCTRDCVRASLVHNVIMNFGQVKIVYNICQRVFWFSDTQLWKCTAMRTCIEKIFTMECELMVNITWAETK